MCIVCTQLTTHEKRTASSGRRSAINDPGAPPRPAVPLGRVGGGGVSGGGGGGVGIVREGGRQPYKDTPIRDSASLKSTSLLQQEITSRMKI